MISSALATTLVLFALLGMPTCSYAQTIGWIESFTGPQSEYELLRENGPIPVSMFLPLRDGDRIRVLREGSGIRLVLDGGTRVVDLSSATQLEVTTRGRTLPTVPVNLLSWAGSWLTVRHQESLSTVNVLVRSRRVSLPLFTPGPQSIPGPLRQLAITWEGGLSPYGIALSSSDAPANPIAVTQSVAPRAVLAGIALQPGEYTVRVVDSQMNAASARFLVSDGASPSALPDELLDTALPGNLRQTLLATWLAAPQNGQRTLQAYQLVAPIADNYYPAALLRDALESGEGPTLPKQ
jgi:hypothetical protein